MPLFTYETVKDVKIESEPKGYTLRIKDSKNQRICSVEIQSASLIRARVTNLNVVEGRQFTKFMFSALVDWLVLQGGYKEIIWEREVSENTFALIKITIGENGERKSRKSYLRI